MKAALREGGVRTLNVYLGDRSTSRRRPARMGDVPRHVRRRLGAWTGWSSTTTRCPAAPPPATTSATRRPTRSATGWASSTPSRAAAAPPGDFVDDTEPEATAHFGCPDRSTAARAAANDPVDNFMSYSDDACMHRFTAGQGNRMHDQTAPFRNGAPTGAAQSDLDLGRDGGGEHRRDRPRRRRALLRGHRRTGSRDARRQRRGAHLHPRRRTTPARTRSPSARPTSSAPPRRCR